MPTDRRHISPQWQLRILAVISFVTVAITTLGGVAHAAPTPTSPVQFRVSTTANTLVVTVDHGSVSTAGGKFAIRNLAGETVFSMPLAYRKEYRQFPIDAHTSGRSATLIPSRDVSRSVAVDPAGVDALRVKAAQIVGPQTRQQRDDEALARFSGVLGAGLTISSIVGTALGAIVGGVIGCIPGLVAALAGCIPGFLTGASIGSVVGLILGGGGSLVGAAIQYFMTITSPFVPQKR
ncbi:glycine zipper family protein [Gordonia sp. CPCC 205515]|uniref:glycine zipper family protein n=1 Tax=Gordonia sp. CPCC 205515 TaxID=3140791 RepID=UPI003AF3633F